MRIIFLNLLILTSTSFVTSSEETKEEMQKYRKLEERFLDDYYAEIQNDETENISIITPLLNKIEIVPWEWPELNKADLDTLWKACDDIINNNEVRHLFPDVRGDNFRIEVYQWTEPKILKHCYLKFPYSKQISVNEWVDEHTNSKHDNIQIDVLEFEVLILYDKPSGKPGEMTDRTQKADILYVIKGGYTLLSMEEYNDKNKKIFRIRDTVKIPDFAFVKK